MRIIRLFYIIVTTTCCLQGTDAFCQPIENHFTHYIAKDGLAEGPIYGGIIQDSIGFLWIGCGNGLSRFDGHTFKTYRYDPLDTNSLRENRIQSVFLDSKNRMWLTTAHWLYLFHPDGEWFEHFSVVASGGDGLSNVCAEENGCLILAGHKSLYKFDMKRKRFSFFLNDVINTISFRDYKKDEDGIEWIATELGLVRYDPVRKSRYIFDSSVLKHEINRTVPIMRILLLPDGFLLATTYYMGFVLINRKTNQFKQFPVNKINPEDPLPLVNPNIPAKDRFDGIYQLNDSIVLCSCAGGLSVFNWRTGCISFFKPDKSDPASLLESDTRIYNMFKDREGIIWLGGENLEKYDFSDYNVKMIPQNGKEQMRRQFAPFYDLYRCVDGKFLMGHYWGMSIYDPPTGLLVNNDDKEHVRRDHFIEDGRGNIWCRAKDKLRVFSIKNNRADDIKQYQPPGNLNSVYNVAIDHKGRLLVAVKNKGLAIFDTALKTFAFFDTVSPFLKFTGSQITAICEDHNGCIWLGTPGGINKLGKDGRAVRWYNQNKSGVALPVDWNINDIKEDRHGIIWFATYEHGIGRIDPRNDSLSIFSIAQGLPTCWFDKICIDDNDNLWAVSRMGIINLNVVTLQNKLYTEDEGFPSPGDINTIHYSKYTKNLYILTPYSIFEIESKNTEHNNQIPQTIITDFSVFNKEISVYKHKDISLKYNENFINIQFACLIFHSNRQIKYAYKMDGIDKDWVYCNYKRNAPYTSLPPGHYTFNVKAQGPDGTWNNPTQLSIIIAPPFWQTWWFYLVEAIAVIAFVFWLFKFYTDRKLAKQKIEFEKLQAISNERTRIAADMHDELRAGLTSIRMLSEIASGKIKHDITAESEIEKIERSATNLSENLREIIWTMNTRFDKLEDFIIYIRSYAVEYFEDSAIKLQFNSPAIIPAITLNGELRRNLFLCIKEALNNIVKHAQATEAALAFNVVENILFIEIKDNGMGINNHVNKFGNGLTTMRERLNKFGSDLEIDAGNGTKLTFKVNIMVN